MWKMNFFQLSLYFIVPKLCYSYSLMNSKVYPQSPVASHRQWSPASIPLRSYQMPPAAVPFPYYGPYYAALSNSDYYYSPADAYPYSSTYDSSDYYPNMFYYIAPSRQYSQRSPYNYELGVAENLDESEDSRPYDEVLKDQPKNSKPSKEWWLQQGMRNTNDEDIERDSEAFDLINNYGSSNKAPLIPREGPYDNRYGAHDRKYESIEAAQIPRESSYDNRHGTYDRKYEGIDGFGRKKEKERVYGTRRGMGSRDDERPKVYGVPVRSKYIKDDEEVRELESLLGKSISTPAPVTITSKPKENKNIYLSPELAGWINGNTKRNSKELEKDVSKPTKNVPYAQPSTGTTSKPNTNIKQVVSKRFKDQEWGKPVEDYIYSDDNNNYNLNDDYSAINDDPQYIEPSSSVFDTIKKLLTMEDNINLQAEEEQKLKKEYLPMKLFPDSNVQPIKRSITTNEIELESPVQPKQRQSVVNPMKKRSTIETDEKLSQELNALRATKG